MSGADTTCAYCREVLTGNVLQDAWGTRVHSHHHIPMCYSCGKWIIGDVFSTEDGRMICKDCLSSIVMKSSQKKWVDTRVRNVLILHGINNLPLKIQVQIVPSQIIKRKNPLKESSTAIQLGLTCCDELILNNNRVCRHSVFMLTHQTKIQFAGTLAHEYLHVWQNQMNIKLSQDMSEGFCNMGTFYMFQSIDNIVAKNYIQRMMSDQDPNYGIGFRKVKEIADSLHTDNLKLVMNKLLTI